MPESVLFLAVIVAVALVFDFTNGAHDSANAIATVVSTKVLSPRTAVLMAAALNLVGAFLGTEVAQTIGKGIVQAEVVKVSKVCVSVMPQETSCIVVPVSALHCARTVGFSFFTKEVHLDLRRERRLYLPTSGCSITSVALSTST